MPVVRRAWSSSGQSIATVTAGAGTTTTTGTTAAAAAAAAAATSGSAQGGQGETQMGMSAPAGEGEAQEEGGEQGGQQCGEQGGAQGGDEEMGAGGEGKGGQQQAPGTEAAEGGEEAGAPRAQALVEEATTFMPLDDPIDIGLGAAGTMDPPAASQQPRKSIFSTPWQEWFSSIPDVTRELLAIRQAHSRTEVKILRDAMVAARTKNALEDATSEFNSASLVPKPGQESFSRRMERIQSPGGQMLLRDLQAAVYIVKLRISTKSSVCAPGLVDLDTFSRALTTLQQALLCCSSLAPFYIRSAQDAKELLEKYPELDARKSNSRGL
ncbi:hypothetical protein BDZ90DRAFT_262504 [Jaminaea rosea]|uniref:Uncharacterized protein n=1 Tax=Jaminaea rosea TaxID=1569628 RepID=A0A316UI76_9BASI|nr:hypothetical protein BDZ90DRAFT_262504 [Jaminaea rosea]PWN25047.1 hypothetical protein BDZ90DRAFT_262504 [Jaminaea rosea]